MQRNMQNATCKTQHATHTHTRPRTHTAEWHRPLFQNKTKRAYKQADSMGKLEPWRVAIVVWGLGRCYWCASTREKATSKTQKLHFCVLSLTAFFYPSTGCVDDTAPCSKSLWGKRPRPTRWIWTLQRNLISPFIYAFEELYSKEEPGKLDQDKYSDKDLSTVVDGQPRSVVFRAAVSFYA